MSVAFRRESDEEHLEPKFKRPIAPGPNFVTPRGLAQIEGHIEALTAKIAGAVEGKRRERLKRDLRYWQTRRATAEVVATPTNGTIGIGSRARVRVGASERLITIVGNDEADPKAGLVGFQALLARALIGAVEGDEVSFGDGVGSVVKADNGEG